MKKVYMEEMEIINSIEKLLNDEKESLRQMKKEIRNIRGGTLHIKRRGDCVFYVEYLDGKECGINKDKDKIYKLARKRYLHELIKIKEASCGALDKTVTKIQDRNGVHKITNLLNQFENLDLKHVIYDADMYKWACEAYNQNNFRPEAKIYSTIGGVKMRSKSERTIGNKLEEREIVYRYEAALEVYGKTYYPDFMVRKKDGSIVIWEHLGLMDNEEYYLKAIQKIKKYRTAGYKQYSNFICTWEEDLHNIENLDMIIERFCI